MNTARQSPVRTFSGTHFPGYYLIVQALAFSAWWGVLWQWRELRAHFLPPGAAEEELMAFLLPDVGVAVLTSFAAGVAYFLRSAWTLPLSWFSAGAVVYAAIYCVSWAILREGGWLNVACMLPAALFATLAAIDGSYGRISLFRRAAEARAPRHVTVTFIQVVIFWSFFLFVVPWCVAYIETQLGWPPAFDFYGQRIAAGALFLMQSVLGMVSGYTMSSRGSGTPLPFDAPNRLVVAGPYAYLRNPMVVAGLGQGLAVAVWMGSPLVVVYVVTGALIWQCLVRPAEERDLAALHGEPYARYCDAVACWWPRRTPYRADTTGTL